MDCSRVFLLNYSYLFKLPFVTLPGSSVKPEPVDTDSFPDQEIELKKPMDFIRPDTLLASDWFGQSAGCVKDCTTMTDAIASFLGDDLATDYKHLTTGCSSLSQELGIGYCAWNNMPAVCQMSDLP